MHGLCLIAERVPKSERGPGQFLFWAGIAGGWDAGWQRRSAPTGGCRTSNQQNRVNWLGWFGWFGWLIWG
jgi:hypothetical protein